MTQLEGTGVMRTRICSVDEIPPGTTMQCQVGGRSVLVANVGGTFYAVDEECTHDGAPLSDGDLEGPTIVCPWHFSRFCLRTGSVLESPAREPLRTYAVDTNGGEVTLLTTPAGTGVDPQVR